MNTTTGMVKNKSNNYFSEKEMIKLVKQYKNGDESSFNEFYKSINKLINGMLNKEFSYNTYIINNRDDVIAECMYEIIRSLKRFDPDKGRLYAYLNRIIKNTAIKYYNKYKKTKTYELSYTDLIKNIDSEGDDINLDNIVFSISMKVFNTQADDSFNSQDFKLKPMCKNIPLELEESIYIIYKYLSNLKDCLNFYYTNVKNDDIINDMIYKIENDLDLNIEFKFNSLFKSKKRFYRELITNIYQSLSNILTFIENKYGKIINKDENTINYDGIISKRSVGYLRNIVNNYIMENHYLAEKYGADNIVKFIDYLVKERYRSYDDK